MKVFTRQGLPLQLKRSIFVLVAVHGNTASAQPNVA